MREYRGKREDTGEWVYGDLVHDWSKHNTKPDIVIQNNIGKYKVFPETVGQEIGLRDKNGKLMFEGDIVILRRIGIGFDIATVVYRQNGFYAESNSAWGLYDFSGTESVPYDKGVYRNEPVECKVIGNIHDNPELLERKDGAE